MLKAFRSFFIHSSIPNIRLYYLLTVFNSAWFISGNWIFFWTRFMTFGQLGWIDASAFLFGLIMEIPSGAISDLLGKRKTIIAAQVSSAIGTLGMAFATSMWQLWGFFLFAQLGWALYSGAAEALVYDTLVDKEKQDEFDKIMSVTSAIRSVVSVTAIFVGGFLFAWHFRLSHLAWGVSNVFALIVSFWLIEPKVDSEKFSWRRYWTQLVDGTKHLFIPQLKPYLLIMFALLGFDYLYHYGLIKPAVAIHFGFSAGQQAFLFAAIGALMAVLVMTVPWLRKRISDKRGLFLLTVLMSLGFLGAALPLHFAGIIPMLAIHVAGTLAFPWVSSVVNAELDAKFRATSLSTLALITKIPYVVLAIVAGNMVEHGQLPLFLLGVGVTIVISLLCTIFFLPKRQA